MNILSKIIKDAISEDGPDGSPYVYCGAKISAFIALFSYLGIALYSVHLSHTIDLSAFGTGLGIVLAGSAAIIAGKQATMKSSE